MRRAFARRRPGKSKEPASLSQKEVIGRLVENIGASRRSRRPERRLVKETCVSPANTPEAPLWRARNVGGCQLVNLPGLQRLDLRGDAG